MRLVTIATCNLNQWALDFQGNLSRILGSLRAAKERGARYRVGPELEITGYGCEDHFLEEDTIQHAWECLGEILSSDCTVDLLCDVGMPLIHHGVRYNCRAWLLNRQILFIRPKRILAEDGNYREQRWFSPWVRPATVEDHVLPPFIQGITGQHSVPIGDALLELRDCVMGSETCEEIFAASSPHTDMWLNGVDIISNGSGSHHQLRKLNQRVDLIRNSTAKCGGVYLYANQQGCDGGRLYYDGCAMISFNGDIIAQGSQFSLHDIEVVTATVDLEGIQSLRGAQMNFSFQASRVDKIPRIAVDFFLQNKDSVSSCRMQSAPMEVRYHTPEEEIALGPACWLWDYLVRSGGGGFFLPLSGGADSASTASIVGSMCQLVLAEIRCGNSKILEDLRRVVREPDFVPVTHQEIANRILHTTYMGTRNSSVETRDRAKRLAQEIGAFHLDTNVDSIVDPMKELVSRTLGFEPRFRSEGGSEAENLALQNIQARERMVFAYFLAAMLPMSRNRQGYLLVLGAGNVDEALTGYMTKYDCSSADLNPIGSISKRDLRRFLGWAAKHLSYETLSEIEGAKPTAELEPTTSTYTQTDEEDLGMTYDELSEFGRLRKIDKCGPLSMFERLVNRWTHMDVPGVAVKVKHFFRRYSMNRHKLTVLTPSYHAESYSPEDNRFDLRPFLYNPRWEWQFSKMDALVSTIQLAESADTDRKATGSDEGPPTTLDPNPWGVAGSSSSTGGRSYGEAFGEEQEEGESSVVHHKRVKKDA